MGIHARRAIERYWGPGVEPGNTLGERYELTEKVGAGGVGEVWRSTDTVLNRVVAVKVLRPELADDAATVRRFAAEARIMARLNHPGIAGVYDFGQDPDGTAYLVMTFVEGEPLRRVLAAHGGTLPPEQVMTFVAEAADALDAAHEAGVIHRDVKPVNLIIRPDGTLILTDFGIARAAGNDVTGAGLVVGTARYLAPEQAAGRDLTPAVDIYALGVTAFECLAGKPPFDADNPLDVARQHISAPAPPLPGYIPRRVRDLVSSMLAKDPEARPSAAALASSARTIAEGRSISDWAGLVGIDTPASADHSSLNLRSATGTPLPWRSGRQGSKRRSGILFGAGAGVLAMIVAASIAAFGPGDSADGGSTPVAGTTHGPARGTVQPAVGLGTGNPLLPSTAGAPPSGAVMPGVPVTMPPVGGGGQQPGGLPTRRPTSSSPSTTSGGPPPTTQPPTPTPDQVTVPSVVTLPEPEARDALATAGLLVNVDGGTGVDCFVQSQLPTGGSTVERGSTVTITTVNAEGGSCAPSPLP